MNMTKDEFFDIVKPGDYIVVEFEYEDEENGIQPGFCKGIVQEIIYDWSDPDNGYVTQDVILCSKLITVDGIEPEDGDFYVGGANDNVYRFMAESEIKEFNSNFNSK